jgi:hypothetical protein
MANPFALETVPDRLVHIAITCGETGSCYCIDTDKLSTKKSVVHISSLREDDHFVRYEEDY